MAVLFYHSLRTTDMKNESILVLARTTLASAGLIPHQPGLMPLSPDRAALLQQLVAASGLFLPRPAMEVDATYKQIIPYMAFVHERRLFVMQRSAQAGEQRLAGKYTVGIGGHVRAADVGSDGLVGWGSREFAEEVAYAGTFSAMTLSGVVNDERDAVGQVHLGVLILLAGDSDCIMVRSELASGVLMDRAGCLGVFDRMETWSQFVVLYLIEQSVL